MQNASPLSSIRSQGLFRLLEDVLSFLRRLALLPIQLHLILSFQYVVKSLLLFPLVQRLYSRAVLYHFIPLHLNFIILRQLVNGFLCLYH